jgi:hypothetical protein
MNTAKVTDPYLLHNRGSRVLYPGRPVTVLKVGGGGHVDLLPEAMGFRHSRAVERVHRGPAGWSLMSGGQDLVQPKDLAGDGACAPVGGPGMRP